MLHRVLLVLILLPTTLPATAQTTVGVRAGLDSAKMAVPGGVAFAPCPPETDCPSSATDPVRGLTFGADFDIPISSPGGAFGLRFGAAYVEKGGAGSGYDARGEPDSGTISTSYVQLSMLLPARTSGRQSVIILFGPWAGGQLSCEKEGDVAANCGAGDAGVAALSDEELLQEIRTVLKASPFLGEGHRKVKARLAAKGIRVGKNRVLRLMREHGLLAPVRRGRPCGDRTHSGRIRTETPDELWGMDASRFWTKAEGWCWFFAAVDHCASDVVGWHVAKKGDRWAALEPVRQGVRAHMGGFDKAIALGLGLRHDWGSQYRARQFQAEIKWLGIRSTPAYVGEPK